MPISLFKNLHRHYRLCWFIQDYWEICAVLHRKRDLEQLLAWATCKRRFGPRNHYWNLLIDEDQRLWR